MVLFILQPVRTQREEHHALESRGWKQHQEAPVQKFSYKIEEFGMLLSTRKYVDRAGSFPRQAADVSRTGDSLCRAGNAVPWNASPHCYLLQKTSISMMLVEM